jgi:hypothetical protein
VTVREFARQRKVQKELNARTPVHVVVTVVDDGITHPDRTAKCRKCRIKKKNNTKWYMVTGSGSGVIMVFGSIPIKSRHYIYNLASRLPPFSRCMPDEAHAQDAHRI